MRNIIELYENKKFQDIVDIAKNFKDSNNVEILEIIAKSFLQLNLFKEAAFYFQKALKLNPSSFISLFNLAGLYFMFGDFKESIKLFEKALSLYPSNYEIYYNIGVVYQEMNMFRKAKRYYKKALSLNPKNVSSLYNLSLIYLTEGDYLKGFDYYRYRYHPDLKNRQTAILSYEKLLTKEENFKDKEIFIYNEQGLGDMIQFIRFLSFFKEAKKIDVKMPKPLKRLFEYNFKDVNFVDYFDNYDYHFPLMEAPFILNMSKKEIPFSEGYLKVDRKDSLQYKNNFIFDDDRIKIGIVWRTNLSDSSDLMTKIRSKSKREIPLEKFIKYFDLDKVKLFSLQKEESREEKELLKKHKIVSLDDSLNDFYDTALAIDNLDKIVSIDTSVVHLSGAMGKESCVLVPFNNDWRWGVDEKISNWYGSVRIFRQSQKESWDEPLREVRDYLSQSIV